MRQTDSIIERPDMPNVEADGLYVVGIGGTKRPNSRSETALRRALSFAERLGARTHVIAGDALPDQIYDPGSSERSREAKSMIAHLRRADVLVVSTPAYHGSVSGCIKNALDYIEDMRSDARPYLDGIPVAVISCAMGWQAGGATLAAMRSIVHSLRGWPTPLGVIVNTATTTFGPDYACSDGGTDNQIRTMVEQAVRFAQAMSGPARWLPAAGDRGKWADCALIENAGFPAHLSA